MTRLAAVAIAAALILSGCSVDASAPGAERTVLLAPDFVAEAATAATDDPQARWLLTQPGEVRASFVEDVLDRSGDRDLLATAWLLRQPDAVQASYVDQVVEPGLP